MTGNMLNLLDKIAQIEPEEFIAPIPKADRVDVFAVWQGIPHRYLFTYPVSGWWKVIPRDGHYVKPVNPAEPWEVYSYLSHLPRIYAIATIPVDDHTWLAVPYNGADAHQRGWRHSEPKTVHLVSHTLRMLDVIVVRSLAGMLLYEDVDTRLGESARSDAYRESVLAGSDNVPPNRDWHNAYKVVKDWLADVRAREVAKKFQEKTATLQERAKWQLEFMGATLLNMSQEAGGYLVRWLAPDGMERAVIIREDTRIQTAGICLDGTDNQHNLSSIVRVMEGRSGGYRQDWDEYDED